MKSIIGTSIFFSASLAAASAFVVPQDIAFDTSARTKKRLKFFPTVVDRISQSTTPNGDFAIAATTTHEDGGEQAEPEEKTSISSTILGTRTSTPGSVLGLGENDALTYLQSGSHCLDLFFDIVPSIERSKLHTLLANAWDEDPLITLKIIFQLGDPRQGKQDLENFYQSMLWLYEHHFDTFLLNLKCVPKFSYYKALLDILQLSCEGADSLRDTREPNSSFWKTKMKKKQETNQANMKEFFKSLPEEIAQGWNAENCKSTITIEYEDAYYGLGSRTRRCWKDDEMRTLFVEFVHSSDKAKSSEARIKRKAKNASLKAHANRKRKEDKKYAAFYDNVAQIFADNLQMEQEKMINGTKSLSGLAAKWAPTVGGSHDRHTNIVDGIVEKIFPEEMCRLSNGTYEEYLSFMTDRYRKEYLTPQRSKAQVPEHYIGTGEWQLVNYTRMASRCRYVHGHIYESHDADRYRQYIEDARKDFEEGKEMKKIVAGALLPHELVAKKDLSQKTEINLQWLRIIQDVKESGSLSSALSICDVSGSMWGQPMEAAVALSLLISDVADGFWKNKIIPFSESPKLVTVPEATVDNLWDRAEKVKGIDWGYNTNFQAVFELLLETASFFNAKPEDMPELLFCFSDMEFDIANDDGNADWATDVELIRTKYALAGYTMPKLVFWNLRGSPSRPASSSEPGVAMLSGFSAGLMKAFLEFQLDDFTPQAQLVKALTPYGCLVVADTDK